MSTTPWKPKKLFVFFFKFKIDKIKFYQYHKCPYPEKRNRSGFVDISPTLVFDTSMEMSSRRVLQHGSPKRLCLFQSTYLLTPLPTFSFHLHKLSLHISWWLRLQHQGTRPTQRAPSHSPQAAVGEEAVQVTVLAQAYEEDFREVIFYLPQGAHLHPGRGISHGGVG